MVSFAGKHGVYSAGQRRAIAEIKKRIKADKIHTVRVGFADQHGVIRGKAFTAGQLDGLFEDGMAVPSSLLLKDLSHRTVLPVWQGERTGLAGLSGIGDIVLMPDPDRFHVLPWTGGTGWIQADIYHRDGMPSPLDTRGIARRAVAALADEGHVFNAGIEIEAHVYRLSGAGLSQGDIGQPGTPPAVEPLNRGYQLLTEHFADGLDPVMELIRRTCHDLCIPLRSLEVEFGPSQIEFTCGVRPGAGAADDVVLLRNALRQVLARHGYHISFMCRPGIEGSFASGWHLHQSLATPKGENLFIPPEGRDLSDHASKWMAGLLHHASAMTLFGVPTVTGYKRYRAHSMAPERICWSVDGRGALLRSLCRPEDAASRIENRGGEPAANPYLYLAGQIHAGLDGLKGGHALPEAAADAYAASLPPLPSSLGEAIGLAEADPFVRGAFGEVFTDVYAALKRAEAGRFDAWVTDWEHREYFASF